MSTTRSQQLLTVIALITVPIAVSGMMGYVDGDLEWGVVTGVVTGFVVAVVFVASQRA